MGSQQRLWAALESVPGLCAVASEWKALLVDEYVAASRFLRPDGRSASGYPCTSRPQCGCVHDVVEHGPDDIVSVCRCEPRECDPQLLTRADVLLHEVNRRALGEAVARALGAAPEDAPLSHPPMTWKIGTLSPRVGARFPIYLTVQIERDDFRHVVDALVARAEGPFILAAPTRDMFGTVCAEPPQRSKAHFLALADDFVLDADGAVNPRRPVEEILKPFLDAVLPTLKDEREAEKVQALSEAAERVLEALQKYGGRPWPGSAALCRDAGTALGKRRSPMHRVTFGTAVSELVKAGVLDLKGKSRPRKGCGWALVRSAHKS